MWRSRRRLASHQRRRPPLSGGLLNRPLKQPLAIRRQLSRHCAGRPPLPGNDPPQQSTADVRRSRRSHALPPILLVLIVFCTVAPLRIYPIPLFTDSLVSSRKKARIPVEHTRSPRRSSNIQTQREKGRRSLSD
uniref:Uncharacterized protein n=1 Tax=Plectus sambesii TaxID=2011161 RepID=A0A914WZH6_9BILA